MAHADIVASALARQGGALCDDCLSAITGISPRQTARAVALRLSARGVARRDEYGTCLRCHQPRHCTYLADNPRTTPVTGLRPLRSPDIPDRGARDATATEVRPWHWEGHVQAAVERWLEGHGWTIEQAADTASKQQGIDLIATAPGRRLWVTVKGYPEQTDRTVAPTQARHWFSHAMFDVILYRERDRNVEIAVALPDPFPTYRNNAARVQWFQRVARFGFLWVNRQSEVRTQEPSETTTD